MDDYLEALRRVAGLNPDTVLPSHGPPLPGTSLAATIAHREQREATVLHVLADGSARELSAIAAAAYADTPEAPPFLREMQTRSHLARLVRRGRVARSGESYRGIGMPGITSLS
jgi:glyoxylase-like metal-dependent hydrolase (beta-lactamase superfamily II)